jgi:hypothetical protein
VDTHYFSLNLEAVLLVFDECPSGSRGLEGDVRPHFDIDSNAGILSKKEPYKQYRRRGMPGVHPASGEHPESFLWACRVGAGMWRQ